MITLCLCKVKVFWGIMIAHYYQNACEVLSMATNKIQTGIRFEPELLYKITQVARYNKRSLNAQLEFLAQTCVKEFEVEIGPILVDEDALYNK